GPYGFVVIGCVAQEIVRLRKDLLELRSGVFEWIAHKCPSGWQVVGDTSRRGLGAAARSSVGAAVGTAIGTSIRAASGRTAGGTAIRTPIRAADGTTAVGTHNSGAHRSPLRALDRATIDTT